MSEPLDLDAIEKACKAATPGPWKVFPGSANAKYFENCNDLMLVGDQYDTAWIPETMDSNGASNAEFIANAREWVPALVKRVRELERSLGRVAKEARLMENEACAKILEDAARFPGLMGQAEIGMLQQLVSAIRARGK